VRNQKLPLYLVVLIGLVSISGFAAAAVPLGELNVNTTVSMVVTPALTLNEPALIPASAQNESETVATPVQNSIPVVQLSVSLFNASEVPPILCTGNVTVVGRPIPGATVHLLFDDYGVLDCTTDETGTFNMLVNVGPGRHSVVANVSSVDPSQSRPALSPRVTIEVPGIKLPLLPMAVGGIILLAGGTALFFRRRGRRIERQPEPEVPPLPEVAPVAETEDLLQTARTLAAGDLRKGIEAIYLESLVRLDQQQPGVRLRTRTPREIRVQFEGTPIAAPITAMTAIYEAVVYSGHTPVDKDRREMIDLFVAVFSGSERADQ
jgi:hypothetical protein